MLLRVVSFIIPFVMLFIGFEICNLDDNNVLLGIKFPKIQEVPIALKEYKKLFRAYLVIFWAIINSIIMVVNISVREGYIPLMIILTIIIDGIIIIFVHYIINTKLKALKHREGWEKLIYNNPTFVDRKSGESLTVDDSDYIFGIF